MQIRDFFQLQRLLLLLFCFSSVLTTNQPLVVFAEDTDPLAESFLFQESCILISDNRTTITIKVGNQISFPKKDPPFGIDETITIKKITAAPAGGKECTVIATSDKYQGQDVGYKLSLNDKGAVIRSGAP